MSITVPYHVNFFDTDAMAVVHHSNYIRWFEIGRVEYLRRIGITLNDLMADGFLFPITEIDARYHHAARFDDNLLIETTAVALTKAKMAFAYRILRVSNSDLLVTGHSQNVFTSIATGKITRLSEKYYKKLAAAMEKETAGN